MKKMILPDRATHDEDRTATPTVPGVQGKKEE